MSIDLREVTPFHPLLGELCAAPTAPAPELYCPIEPAVHPSAPDIHARSVAWARAMELADSERAVKRLHAARIGWLVARAYPAGAPELVQLAADWTVLFCGLDDRLEKLDSPAAVTAYLAELMGVLIAGHPASGDALFRAAASLHARLARLAPAALRARFADRIAQLFAMFTQEAEVRALRAIPELDVYLPMREVTVGLHAELVLGELICDIDLSPEARNHPVRVALARKASNIVGWANDIHTYEKELRDGELTNLVAVLARAYDLSLVEAVARAVEMHDHEVRSFLALMDHLPPLGGVGDDLRRYAAMLRSWIRGHLDWAHETGRYAPERRPAA